MSPNYQFVIAYDAPNVCIIPIPCIIVSLLFLNFQVRNFPYLGRIHNSVTTMRDSTFESKAYGKRVNKLISIQGRVQFDLFQVYRIE